MVLLGCTPNKRLTEQHDIFFGIGASISSLLADMYQFWPDGGRLHIDAWREVTQVDGHAVSIIPKNESKIDKHLFFVNLGGYKKGEFEEYHYKILSVANSMSEAVKSSKKTAFYKHYDFKGATSHIDDKYALDADDLHNVADILMPHFKEKYSIQISETDTLYNDELHIGYMKLDKKPNGAL